MMVFLRCVYAVGIAVLLIVLVIVGVEAFYPAPPYPDYPALNTTAPFNSPEYQQAWDEWRQEWDRVDTEHREQMALHSRNVFLGVLPLGALFAVGGAFLRRRLDVFGAGLILGGVGTMIYAIVPSELDSVLRFVGIAVALAVLIFVGFRVFASARQA